MDKKKIGLRIKGLRAENGLSQKDLSNRLGIDRTTLSKIESGENAPTASILIELKQIFSVSIDWILTGVGFREHVETEDYSEDVKELLNGISQDKMLKHALLSFFYTYKSDKKRTAKRPKKMPNNNNDNEAGGNNGG